MENDLNGTLVLVNPEFKDDPHQRAGQTGTIFYIDEKEDDVLLTFSDGKNALYSSDALLTLKRPGEVYQNALVHIRDMDAADFKTLLKINLAQETRDPQQLRHALQFAQSSSKVMQYSLDVLQDKLRPVAQLSQDNERPPSISR